MLRALRLKYIYKKLASPWQAATTAENKVILRPEPTKGKDTRAIPRPVPTLNIAALLELVPTRF